MAVESMTKKRNSQMTLASRVQVGDAVWDGDRFVVVTKIRRAQGRKPPTGENLHLLADDHVVKVNSLDPVRIRREKARDQTR